MIFKTKVKIRVYIYKAWQSLVRDDNFGASFEDLTSLLIIALWQV